MMEFVKFVLFVSSVLGFFWVLEGCETHNVETFKEEVRYGWR